MAYRKFNVNGREMLVLDNRGMVDYNDYYIILGKSFERRSDITTKYQIMQNDDLIENEPSINYTVQYRNFLEDLKSFNPEIYDKKSTLLKDYLNELNEEEKLHFDEINTLLANGCPFDSELKKYGLYVISVDNSFYQYKRVVENDIKIDIGTNLLPQNVSVSSLELIPITLEQLEGIKRHTEIKKEEIARTSLPRRHR